MGDIINGSLTVNSFLNVDGEDNVGLNVKKGDATVSTGDVSVDAGNVIIGDGAKGFVHTGSGTVTQGTSHSTAVELNKTSGVITLHSSALNAGAEADFAVTNSTVKTDSIILLTVQSTAAASATDNATLCAQLDEVNAGSFNIRLTNPGAGNVDAGAYKIHFLVINVS